MPEGLLQFITTGAIVGFGIYAKAKIVEDVKKTFTKENEKLKAELNKDVLTEVEKLRATFNKENIRFQINQTEYSKLRFEKIGLLFSSLCEIEHHNNTSNNNVTEEARSKLENLIKEANNNMYKASFFIDQTILDLVKEFLSLSQTQVFLWYQYLNDFGTWIEKGVAIHPEEFTIAGVNKDKSEKSLEHCRSEATFNFKTIERLLREQLEVHNI